MDSGKSVLASHEAPAHLPGGLIGNGTSIHVLLIRASVLAPHIEDEAAVRSTNSVGVIFRCALVPFVTTHRADGVIISGIY